MKDYFRLIAAAVMLAIATTGCGIYNPVCVDIPLMQEKGEVQLEGGVVVPDGYPALRGSFAWSAADNFAVAGSLDPQRRYSQLMIGTFRPVGENFVWELYAGYGGGGGWRFRDPQNEDYSKYTVDFVQFNAGWRNLTKFMNIDVAFSFKTGLVTANSSLFYGFYYDSISATDVELTREVSGCRLLLEPTAELRFGWPDLKFNIKLAACWIANNRGDNYLLPYMNTGIGFGVSYRIHNAGRRKMQ